MEREGVAGSLMQLQAQRKRAAQASRTGSSQGIPQASRKAAALPVDEIGQFGFSFEAPPVAASVVEVTRRETVVREVRADAAVVRETVEVERLVAPPSVLPARARGDAPWTVGELVGTLRGTLEGHGPVWVVGEICNLRPAASGHLYFTLKDGDAALGVVLFRRQASMLEWRPTDGAAVLLKGRLSVFEGRGQLQIIAESLEPRGAGALQLQFERLKARLRDEGLFDAERKRALPAYPRRVGVVTSLQGAVIRDIVTVCRRRNGCMNLLVYPAAVQGVGAAAEIAAGIRYFNRAAERDAAQAVDLIVLARGGGSAEDLAAFNDEALARTIAASDLPVVSAVGHETDFTIADFVADLRAPTPSAAAEIITESQHRVEERVQSLHGRLFRAVRFQQMTARQRYTRLATDGVLRRAQDAIERRQQRVDVLSERLERASQVLRRDAREQLHALTVRLQRQDVRQQLRHAQLVLASRTAQLLRSGAGLGARPSNRLERAGARLMALSPLAVLQRGYALSFTAEGKLVCSAAQLAAGETMVTRFAEGSAVSQIVNVNPDV